MSKFCNQNTTHLYQFEHTIILYFRLISSPLAAPRNKLYFSNLNLAFQSRTNKMTFVCSCSWYERNQENRVSDEEGYQGSIWETLNLVFTTYKVRYEVNGFRVYSRTDEVDLMRSWNVHVLLKEATCRVAGQDKAKHQIFFIIVMFHLYKYRDLRLVSFQIIIFLSISTD